MAIKDETAKIRSAMDEGRKRVLLITAAVAAARKLAGSQAGIWRTPGTMSAIADAVQWAEDIMADNIRKRFIQPAPVSGCKSLWRALCTGRPMIS
jgi:hypothetical protein